jgi:hypothetical protein
MLVRSFVFVCLCMQVSLGRIFAVKEQPNAKGLTPNTKFKVELLDPFIFVFYA